MDIDYLIILKKTILCNFKFSQNLLNMQELNNDGNPVVLTHKDEVISFKCELQENLQKAMNEFVEKHPHWDQYRILQAAIAGFLMQKGFQNRDLTRLYIGNMFSMSFKDYNFYNFSSSIFAISVLTCSMDNLFPFLTTNNSSSLN